MYGDREKMKKGERMRKCQSIEGMGETMAGKEKENCSLEGILEKKKKNSEENSTHSSERSSLGWRRRRVSLSLFGSCAGGGGGGGVES